MVTKSILYIINTKPAVFPFIRDKLTDKGMQFLELVKSGTKENQKIFLDRLCSKCQIKDKLQIEHELKKMVEDQIIIIQRMVEDNRCLVLKIVYPIKFNDQFDTSWF